MGQPKHNHRSALAPQTRRSFLRRAGFAGGAALSVVGLGGCSDDGGSAVRVSRAPGSSAETFAHGVASGDPLADRVMLWSRVTPSSEGDVSVNWMLSESPDMANVLRSGTVVTDATRDYTVKADVTGLAAGTTYYYQFETAGERSPMGRTRTLPQAGVQRLRMAVLSCSNYPFGFFNVYGRVAERADLDLVLHLGDYLYEYPGRGVSEAENPDEYGDGRPLGRAPEPPYEIVSLDDYRTRHACYKTDVDLQELHRQHPMIAVWDDHESTNNSWRDGAQNHDPDRGEGPWSAREAASIQAYYEWLPIRETDPDNPERIYRGFEIGDLVSLSMLDTRLIGRDEQLAGNAENGFTDTGDYANDERTLMDDAQRQWLAQRLQQTQARWKLLGQQVMFGQLKRQGAPNSSNTANPGGQGGVFINSDQWDGYPRAREQVWDIIRGGQAAPNLAIDNVVVLTGDIHSSWALDITEDPNDATAYDPETGMGSMGVEFVTTSVTSPGRDSNDTRPVLLSQNPHMKYVELTQRGYLLLDITRERMQAEWWYVDDIESRNDQQRFASAWQVRAGENHVVAADAQSQPIADAPALAPSAREALHNLSRSRRRALRAID
uniref:alkaline phosphatase D family protein n=1 Tax=uncultured Salinisphaera sp. TaxID=359372 RepID=UPI0032B17707